MRKLLFTLCAVGLGSMCMAQDLPDLSNAAVGFGFRVGGFFPADSKLRDVKTAWLDVGIEYDLEKSLLPNGSTYIAFDWTSNTIFGGTHTAGLTINQRFYGGSHRYSAGGAPYFFVGVGGQWVDFKGNTGSGIEARGGVGTEFSPGFFAEVAGTVAPKVHGIDGSGIGISLGYRFK